MFRFLLVSVTGWLAVFGAGVEAALPYILRNTTMQASAGSLPGQLRSLRARMSPHYWLGYALAALVLTHASFVMGPAMGRANVIGIWAATLALCLLFLQVGLGLVLKSGTSNQRILRQWHFWSMIAFIGLTLTHLWKNG